MDKKLLFNEALASIVEFATANGNQLTTNDVEIYFKDLIKDETQYQLVYDYLAANKINIKGANISSSNDFEISDSSKGDLESEEELAFINMYMKEIDELPKVSLDDINDLIVQLTNGNLDVTHSIVEAYLSTVSEIAVSYKNMGTTFGDLIQEGNIALLLGVSSYNAALGDFDIYIKNKIHSTLKNLVEDQISSDRIGQHLADQLNLLDKVTKELTDKSGQVPDIEDIAKAMSISVDEANLLLKTSLDTLSVNEDTGIAADENNGTLENNGALQNDVSLENDGDEPLEWRVNKR